MGSSFERTSPTQGKKCQRRRGIRNTEPSKAEIPKNLGNCWKSYNLPQNSSEDPTPQNTKDSNLPKQQENNPFPRSFHAKQLRVQTLVGRQVLRTPGTARFTAKESGVYKPCFGAFTCTGALSRGRRA